MTYPPVIGIAGARKSGKSTVARILHDLYGYVVIDFNSSIKQTVAALPGSTDAPTWLEAAFRHAPVGHKLVIDGIYYEDEFDSVRQRNGVIWYMGTPGGANYDHAFVGWTDTGDLADQVTALLDSR